MSAHTVKRRVYTIGFTKKSASEFFGFLRDAGAGRLVDVRLNNVSQLAGFAKRDDLEYFLHEICGMEYLHLPELAPTKEMLAAYRNEHRDWAIYERQFLALMDERRIADTVARSAVADSVLLCSEDTPEHCHRRLVAEYLDQHWRDVDIVHVG